MNAAVKSFADWFRVHSHRLYAVSSSSVANEVAEKLCVVDDRLGIEVERQGGRGKRDIIFTAFSDSEAFPVVRAIADTIGELSNWNIHALKPPRGFAFAITLCGHKLRADNLRFRLIPEIEGGFEFLVPHTAISGEGVEEAAWLIAETGIGEELAGRITHLEFGNPADLSGSRPISELAKVLVTVLTPSRQQD